jgi:hypothetical protein
MNLQDKLDGPGVIFCTFDHTLALEYSKHYEHRTEVSLFGKSYQVVAVEWHYIVGGAKPGHLYWFELRELIPCQ